jgi:hypothetical protein
MRKRTALSRALGLFVVLWCAGGLSACGGTAAPAVQLVMPTGIVAAPGNPTAVPTRMAAAPSSIAGAPTNTTESPGNAGATPSARVERPIVQGHAPTVAAATPWVMSEIPIPTELPEVVASRADPDLACERWVTPKSVGAGAFEEYGLAEKLANGEFERWAADGYLICEVPYLDDEEQPDYPKMGILYLFDMADGHLVLTYITYGRFLPSSRSRGGTAPGACTDYITPETVGAYTFEHYGVAEKLASGDLIAMSSRNSFDCLVPHRVDGVDVEGDEMLFIIDLVEQELAFWRIHWREDLPESLPAVQVSAEEAVAKVPGTPLYWPKPGVFSPEDSLFTYSEYAYTPQASEAQKSKESYYRPGWAWMSEEGPDHNTVCFSHVDAVSGEITRRYCHVR